MQTGWACGVFWSLLLDVYPKTDASEDYPKTDASEDNPCRLPQCYPGLSLSWVWPGWACLAHAPLGAYIAVHTSPRRGVYCTHPVGQTPSRGVYCIRPTRDVSCTHPRPIPRTYCTVRVWGGFRATCASAARDAISTWATTGMGRTPNGHSD